MKLRHKIKSTKINHHVKKNEIVNEGGVNGTGKGFVNTNSEDYTLQKAILAHASQQTKEERKAYHLISLKYQRQNRT